MWRITALQVASFHGSTDQLSIQRITADAVNIFITLEERKVGNISPPLWVTLSILGVFNQFKEKKHLKVSGY